MPKKLHKFLLLLAAVFFAGAAHYAQATTLLFVSDTISNSAPAARVNHTIQFTNTNAIPASGKIVITLQDGLFSIPAGLNYSDIDFLVGGANKTLAAVAGSGAGGAIGAVVATGTSGSIIFTLNDTDVISAASAIAIYIGTNAFYGEAGDKQIQNPSAVGSYSARIETKNASNVAIDGASVMIAVVAPVVVATGVSEAPPSPPTPTSTTPSSGGGGGGGGGGGVPPAHPPTTSINFNGWAYPMAKITLLKDGQYVRTGYANQDASFTVSLTGISAGSYNFTIYGEDTDGRHSIIFTFPRVIIYGKMDVIDNIFLPPTIETDKIEARRSDDIIISGQSVPGGIVSIVVDSPEKIFATETVGEDGIYSHKFNANTFALGEHKTQARGIKGDMQSLYGELAKFRIGDKMIFRPSGFLRCDLNGEGKVNIVDFSILAYWYKRPLSVEFAEKERLYFNGDGKVDLVDFSIMAYNWTG